MRVICLTSDNHNWLVRGFLHQWSKYCGLSLIIYGFTDPNVSNMPLPAFILRQFVSLGNFSDFPKERWSNQLKLALEHVGKLPGGELVLLMLEDYWLTRPVNMVALSAAQKLMQNDPGIARFCLSSDRMFSGLGENAAENRRDLGSIGTLDIFESLPPSEYRFSYQASLWRTEILASLLSMGESPWESEILGNERLEARRELRVLSTYQWPMRYQIVVYKGQVDREGTTAFPARAISTADWAELDTLGYTRPA